MASSPRTGRSSYAITAIVIGATIVILAAFVVLLGAGDPRNFVTFLYPPEAVTTQGAAIRELYTIVFLIAVVIFFVVEALIIWSVIRYRRKPGDDTLPPQTHGNNIAETVWTVVPTIIVAFMFVISWQTLNSVEAVSAQPDTKIRAVAGQFQWTFEYLPDDWEPTDNPRKEPLYTQFVPTGADGGLVVPAGRSVHLYLDSPDVIHAFYVPRFLFKRDVVPGRTNSFQFDIEERFAGQTFSGQCAELCGSGHSVMLFDVHATTGAEFDAWLEARIAEAGASPPPPPSGEPGQSGQPGAPAIQITAKEIAFLETDVAAPADTPFQIEFHNEDEGNPHNIEIKAVEGESPFVGEIFPGVETRTYDVPALVPGAYGFICTVHPNMTGTITVN